MTNLTYIFSSLKSRLLGSMLTIMLTAFGVAMVLIVVLFTNHINTRLSQDAQNIDIVVGAKGSPLQIILSSIYHIDIPTGNIRWKDAQKWMNHSHVKKAVPLALGDNWNGHRIVGTTSDYIDFYDAKIKDGQIWSYLFEAVIGSDIEMDVTDKFIGAHGLLDGGHAHGNDYYTVVGRLEKTGTVLDRLILTSLDSVLAVHGFENVESEHEGHDHHDHEGHGSELNEAEITALIIQTRTPIANMNLPRLINQDGFLQAANPAMEMTRLTSMLGIGTKTLTTVSMVLVVIACFSVFAGIAGTLENRKTDLAVLRALGYSRNRIFRIIAGEGFMLVAVGTMLGGVLSVVGFAILSEVMPSLSSSGASYRFVPEMIYIYGGALCAGLFASLIPAYRAGKIEVARQLN